MSLSIEKHLFWVNQEEKIDNDELFFPADTPVGNINLKKRKSKSRSLHERQLRRLQEQQLQELRRFQKKFSERYDHQVYLDSPSAACQFVNGVDFIAQCGQEVAALFNIEPHTLQPRSNDPNQQQQTDDSKRRDSKSMIEARKQDYSLAFRKQFRNGFETIEHNHKQQVERLKSIQNDEISKLNESIHSELVKERAEKEEAEKRLRNQRKIERREELQIATKNSSSNSSSNNSNNNNSSNNSSNNSNNNNTPSNSNNNNDNIKGRKRRKLLGLSSKRGKSPPHAPPTPPYGILNDQNKGKGPSSRAPSSLARPIAPPPSRGPPPVIAVAAKNQGPPPVVSGSSTKRQRTKQTTHSPLFTPKQKNDKKSTVLTDTGTISILNKPARVVVRSNNGNRVIGDPKDYADAISGVKARFKENPVTKRTYNNQPHLFYKMESGERVNVGPVSIIQPLVDKFLHQQ